MKRRTLLISAGAAFARASFTRAPARSAIAPCDVRKIRVVAWRHAGATPGGCANRSRRGDAYTLAFALSGRR